MKTATVIHSDHMVYVLLYDDKDQIVRKITVFPDGKVGFLDFGKNKEMEFIVLSPIRKEEDGDKRQV